MIVEATGTHNKSRPFFICVEMSIDINLKKGARVRGGHVNSSVTSVIGIILKKKKSNPTADY